MYFQNLENDVPVIYCLKVFKKKKKIFFFQYYRGVPYLDISGEIQEVLVFLFSFILSEKNSFSLKSKNQSKWPVSEILSEEYFS